MKVACDLKIINEKNKAQINKIQNTPTMEDN